MRVENLQKAGDGLPHGPLVACVEVLTERELLVQSARVVLAPGEAQRFGEVVGDEAVVVGKEALFHLRGVPAGQVEVHPVEERCVYHGVGEVDEEVALANELLGGLVEVTEED